MSVINAFCVTLGSTVCSIAMFWLHGINLLRLDAVKNLLKCDGAIFDTIQVDKHQETCKTETRERELTSVCSATDHVGLAAPSRASSRSRDGCTHS